jgi:phosphate transport system protein
LLLEMGGLSEESLATALDALLQRDMALVARVRSLELEINELEKTIDSRCLRILAVHRPSASDLRFVTMVMKIASAVERIGDLSSSVGKRAEELVPDGEFPIPSEVQHMGAAVRAMTAEALDAFVSRDATKAWNVLERDDEVDGLHHRLQQKLEGVMQRDPELVRSAMRMGRVVRDLERAADHAVNIAVAVIFMVDGRDVRHG